ncbi:hypothetical protein FNU79_14870 [Deinococcus detaillensis]|uniref:Glycosyl hydrolase-like 10 domain-containing protein n=1 Tax=Deinococcus detaillensis TaxID=2592048 RepID=A0A553UNF3_9DEIO|nr:hypothetical protein [Deinococcus detaillensis]TSA81730.1 hypothetical protein FNU79_14870 [Deinococcus detaillensis]
MSTADKFVGIQISPISFIDEGVEPLLDTLQEKFGINVLLIGTISWLGLKVGRRISYELDGFPDHGVQEPDQMLGGSYIKHRPEYYRNTQISHFTNRDPGLEEKDILDMIIPAARARGMKVMPEVMEPLFKYAGHGSANTVPIPNLPQYLEVDQFGRFGSEPSTSNPHYRTWLHSILEDYARNYDIDGIMWCNERRSPLDNLIAGNPAIDFSAAARTEAHERGIDVQRVLSAFGEVYNYFQRARRGEGGKDGYFVEFLRVLLQNPEILIWERFWLERNQALDRELYGIVKWCNPALSFGLNVWNRNHFNPIRKAQWPWLEQTEFCDWVKPITYQHQAGAVYQKEMSDFHQSILRDFTPPEMTSMMYNLLGLGEAPWDDLLGQGMQPESYVGGQARDTVAAVEGRVPVYMGIGVDAPRTHPDQAKCTPDIVYRSVLAAYQAGAKGVVYSPNYAGMNQSSLAGGAQALRELGLLT